MSEIKKLYKIKTEKARATISAKKAVASREKRRDNALNAFTIVELLAHFKLVNNDTYLCPQCKEADLKVIKDSFACKKCKSKGHAIKLGKLVLKISDWGVIKYIEKLLADKTNCKPVLKNIDQAASENIVEKTIVETPELEKTSVVEDTVSVNTEVKTETNIKEQETIPNKTCYKPVLKNTIPNANQNKIILDRIPAEIAQQHKLQPQELEYLKNSIKITDLVQREGIQLKKSGKNLMGLCPFHEDRKPSLVLTPDKNLWHCFGCSKGGSGRM